MGSKIGTTKNLRIQLLALCGGLSTIGRYIALKSIYIEEAFILGWYIPLTTTFRGIFYYGYAKAGIDQARGPFLRHQSCCKRSVDLRHQVPQRHILPYTRRKKKGCFPNAADERIDHFELLIGDCRHPKSNRIFRLRPRTLDRYVGLANAQGLT